MKMKASLLALAMTALSITGCGVTVPTSYTDPTSGAVVLYSTSDENILKSCATIEANLPLIRSGGSLSVGGILQASIKTPVTLKNDGALCYQISSAVYSMTLASQPTLPTTANLTTIVQGFTSNQTNASVIADVGLITNALNNVYGVYYKQLVAMASQTNNATVKNTIVKTGLDVLNALAGGIMDGTQQYAPVSAAVADFIRWSDLGIA